MITETKLRTGGGGGGSDPTGSSNDEPDMKAGGPGPTDPDPRRLHDEQTDTEPERQARDDGEKFISGDHSGDRQGFSDFRETEMEQRQDLASHEQNEPETEVTAIPGTGGQYSVEATDEQAEQMAFGSDKGKGHDNPNVGSGHDPTQTGSGEDTTGGDHPVLNEGGQEIYNETTTVVNETVNETVNKTVEQATPDLSDLLPFDVPSGRALLLVATAAIGTMVVLALTVAAKYVRFWMPGD